MQPSGTWWSNSPVQAFDDSLITPAVRKLFGMEQQYDQFDSFMRWLATFEHFDAKTAFRAFTGDGDVLPIPQLPPKVEGDIPEQPSAFSDGAFTNPTKPHLGLASAAVWWPGRQLATSPLSQLEQDMSVDRQRSDGFELLTFLDGPTSSSSRAELAGLIVALFSSLPVHIAIDSAAVLGTSQRILTYSPFFFSRLFQS